MFPLVKLRLTFRALQDMNFSAYAGSTLRGIFGKSLRRVSCLAQKTDCKGCAAVSSCPYAEIFENGILSNGGEEVPNPYVIEPFDIGMKNIGQGTEFSFNFLLFGKAVGKMSYALLAWSKTGNMGFTKERTQARPIRVEQICADGSIRLLYDFENDETETFEAQTCADLPPQVETNTVKIKLMTPLRIHRDGHPVRPENLTARDFLITLIRRTQNMAKHHIAEFPPVNFDDLRAAIDSAQMTDANLHWFDWARYSSRQKKRIALGGVMGTFALRGDLTKLTPYLKLGEWLHLGKSAVLGMGKYRIEMPD